jgi:hypothetical protein
MIGLGLGVLGNSGSAFAPGNRGSQLVMWLRGDSIQHTGSTVNSWSDKTANGNNAALNAGTPTYVASNASFNGKPTMHFPGTANLTVATLAVSQGNSVYVVVQQSGNCNLFDGSGNRQLIGSTATPQWYYFAGSAITSGTTATTGVNALVGVFNGASSALYNNSSVAPIATSNPGTSGLSIMLIGSSTGLAAPLTGDIAEIIITNVADSQAQVSQMLGYLAGQYGQAWS